MGLVSEVKPPRIADVSLVIPCNHPLEDLILLIRAVFLGTILPKEILIIRSSIMEPTPKDSLCKLSGSAFNGGQFSKVIPVSIQIYDVDFALPGGARNLGVNHARGDLIAFLDVKTIPEQHWLEEACNYLEDPDLDGVLGSRIYRSNTLLAGLIRDAIYGRLPVQSVAGSVFRRQVYSVTGKMISWAPAGEDGDWMHRVKAHKLSFLMPKKANHNYLGLDDKPLLFFIKKWWRYYHYSRLLPVNNRDRWLSFGLLYIVLIFFAFNWNFKISAAIFGSPLVVPHITTGLVVTVPLAYVFIRGIYLPLRRGVPFLRIFPARFVVVLLVASVLDFIKTLALLLPLPHEHRMKGRSSEMIASDRYTEQPVTRSEK